MADNEEDREEEQQDRDDANAQILKQLNKNQTPSSSKDENQEEDKKESGYKLLDEARKLNDLAWDTQTNVKELIKSTDTYKKVEDYASEKYDKAKDAASEALTQVVDGMEVGGRQLSSGIKQVADDITTSLRNMIQPQANTSSSAPPFDSPQSFSANPNEGTRNNVAGDQDMSNLAQQEQQNPQQGAGQAPEAHPGLAAGV